MKTRQRILGIDPGLRISGYGCIECEPGGLGAITLVEAGVFRLGTAMTARERADVELRQDLASERLSSSGAQSISSRLVELDRDFRHVLDRLRPDVVAVEALFAHYKHPATAIIMAHARGTLLLAIRQMGMELLEFKPTMVKKSVTGNGLARKEQVQRSVAGLLSLAAIPEPPDMADALAVAICASRRAVGAGVAGAMFPAG